jgi:hypothetical protein
MTKRRRAGGVFDVSRGDQIIWYRGGIEAPQRGRVVSTSDRSGLVTVEREFNRREVKVKPGSLRLYSMERWAESMDAWAYRMREHLAELESGG